MVLFLRPSLSISSSYGHQRLGVISQSCYVAKNATSRLQGCRCAVVATGRRASRLPSFLFALCLSPLGRRPSLSISSSYGRQRLGVISQSCYVAKNATSHLRLMPVASRQASFAFDYCRFFTNYSSLFRQTLQIWHVILTFKEGRPMYGEIIIGINTVFNFAILSFANRMGKAQAKKSRLLLASFIGALPVTLFPSSPLAIVFAFLLMVICAFGLSFSSWGSPSLIVLIGALFAGGALTVFTDMFMFSNALVTVFVCALLAYLFLNLLKTKWLDVRTARQLSSYSTESVLAIWNGSINIPTFIDTGNRCTEPITGDAVHFVSLKAVEKILPAQLKEPLQKWNSQSMPQLSAIPKPYQKDTRLIRLQTVQGTSWAVGFKFEKWVIGKGSELPSGYIVLTKQDNRYPEGAGAILHASALEIITNERGTEHVA